MLKASLRLVFLGLLVFLAVHSPNLVPPDSPGRMVFFVGEVPVQVPPGFPAPPSPGKLDQLRQLVPIQHKGKPLKLAVLLMKGDDAELVGKADARHG
jgi:hypothetical protein